MAHIVYPVNLRFPMERANSIQIIQTCHALARAGDRVTLLVRGGKGRIGEVESLAFYGLNPHRNLSIVRLPVLPPAAPAKARNRGFLATLGLSCLRRALIPAGQGRPAAFLARDEGVVRGLLALRSLHRVPVVFEMHHISHLFLAIRHEMYPDSPPVPEAQIERQKSIDERLYRGADAVVCVTEALREMLIETFGDRPDLHVVRNGVHLIEGEPRRDPEPATIIYVGQLYAWKGVDTIVRAVTRLPEAKLLIVGGLPFEPDLARLEALAGAIGVADRVEFRPFVPHGELAAYMARATVTAVPLPDSVYSRYFTSPLKIFEAMAAGIPVVVSDLPAIREVIRDGDNGRLAPPGDPEALADALRALLADPALAAALAARARKDVESYSWERRAARLREIVEGLP
ncbi:MAG: glycosyltransferase family 4 protein [Deltaproteobacteria bacterium]|nr:glycosyltransferase family 4 protein [Deltaproteobacteria bacterium]